MRRYFLFLIISLSAAAQYGCDCCPNGDGVAMTRSERKALHKEIRKNDCQQLTDDWDSFWLNERKGHLSWWKIE